MLVLIIKNNNIIHGIWYKNMLLKNLTSTIMDLKDFCNQKISLENAENGTIAIIGNNKIEPIMYIISPNRLSILLKIEANIAKKKLDKYNKTILSDYVNNIKKFKMYKDWHPGNNFIKLASLWGVNLIQSITREELLSFISYWQVEHRMFYHVQWQQKLARSIQINRKKYFNKKNIFKNSELNKTIEVDEYIPDGFRG